MECDESVSLTRTAILALQTGIVLIFAGLVQVGFLVENLLSSPVLSGFTQVRPRLAPTNAKGPSTRDTRKREKNSYADRCRELPF
jgi:hypothetical protein